MEGNDSFEQTLKKEIVEELSATQELNIIKQVGEVWELPQEFMKDGHRELKAKDVVLGEVMQTGTSHS